MPSSNVSVLAYIAAFAFVASHCHGALASTDRALASHSTGTLASEVVARRALTTKLEDTETLQQHSRVEPAANQGPPKESAAAETVTVALPTTQPTGIVTGLTTSEKGECNTQRVMYV